MCWVRSGTIFFGSAISAVSTVIAAFFAGIALGSYLFGRTSVGYRTIFRTYGILELCIAVVAFGTQIMLYKSDFFLSGFFELFHGREHMLILMRAALIFCIITPVATLIGGVFPLICQLSIHSYDKQSPSPTLLYGVSTFGSLVGCLITGLVLIPVFGITSANLVNCALSALLGVSALILWNKTPKTLLLKKSDSLQTQRAPFLTTQTILIYLFFALTGCATLGFEVVWTRFFSLIIHTTAFTYVFSLSSILLGITIGCMVTRLLPKKGTALLFGSTNILIGITISIIFLRPVSNWDWIRDSTDLSLQAISCIAILLVPSILMGISFPLAMRLVRSDPQHLRGHIGLLLSVNTIGGIVGSLSVGFLFLPTFGLHNTLLIFTNISIQTGILAIVCAGERIKFIKKVALCVAGLGLWLLVWIMSPVRLPHDFLGERGKLIEVREAPSSFLSVVKRYQETLLEIDGMWQGQKSHDYQIMAAHIPTLLHPSPKSVLVIGVGTGQTAKRFLLYDINRLDCADIEKDLPVLIRHHFEGAWLDDPRVNFLAEDGRMVVTYSKAHYDIISIEAGQTFRSVAASLYTIDFYKKIKDRLEPGGLVSQFVPVGFLTPREFSSVMRSFIEVFPQSTLWFNKHAELILIGSPDYKPHLTKERLRLIEPGTRIFNDLAYSFTEDSLRTQNQLIYFTANYLMGMRGLSKIAATGVVYHDDKPELEYNTASIPYSPARFHDLIEKNLEPPASIIDSSLFYGLTGICDTVQRENVHAALR